jgi:hypothetical protein
MSFFKCRDFLDISGCPFSNCQDRDLDQDLDTNQDFWGKQDCRDCQDLSFEVLRLITTCRDVIFELLRFS